MNATKKLVFSIIFLVIASAFSISALVKEKKVTATNNSDNTGLILYYGDTCPHCKIVEEYIKTNNLSNISQKEVYQNQNNKNDFIEAAKICNLDLGNLGVPMLWDEKTSKCYSGDQPIIDFLNNQK